MVRATGLRKSYVIGDEFFFRLFGGLSSGAEDSTGVFGLRTRVFFLLSMRDGLRLGPQVPLGCFLGLFVLGQLLQNIRRQYLLKHLWLEVHLFLQFPESVNVDCFVLEVVGDGAEGQPKEGLVHEGRLQHVHFGEVGEVLEGKQLHYFLEVVVGVSCGEGVDVDDAETAGGPESTSDYLGMLWTICRMSFSKLLSPVGWYCPFMR